MNSSNYLKYATAVNLLQNMVETFMNISEFTSLEQLSNAITFLKEHAPEQVQFISGDYFKHGPNYLFGAVTKEGKLVGVIRYCEQIVGIEQCCPSVVLKGKHLKEAKINAFAVDFNYRNKGIGRRLQQHVIAHAKELGLYQVSSYSTFDKVENYTVKLDLGFCVQPEKQSDGTIGCYFLMKL